MTNQNQFLLSTFWFQKRIFVFLIVINITSCKENSFFRDPPPEPMAKVVKTSAVIGFAAVSTIAYFHGEKSHIISDYKNGNSSVFYVSANDDYPFHFLSDNYEEFAIAAIKVDENVAIISVFFTNTRISVGKFKLLNVCTFPVQYDDEKIIAVYAAEDINFGSSLTPEITLTQDEINIEVERLNTPVPINETVALDQNAWIIEVDHNQTLSNYFDDEYIINGGEQKIEVGVGNTQKASTFQMALIETKFSPYCTLNPVTGIAVMQEVGVETDELGNLHDLLLATALFTFQDECNGRVQVTIATGNYMTSIGKYIQMNL